MRGSARLELLRTLALVLVIAASVAAFLQAARTTEDTTQTDDVSIDPRLSTNQPESPAASPCPPSSELIEPFYGMQFVQQDELGTVRKLGVEVVLMALPHDGAPSDWLGYLDAAKAEGIHVIPWLWPQGWTWVGATWEIDAQARLFLRTVAGHPALLATYGLHEPYWNECEGCGYTTAAQQALYRAIKAIADVPLYSEINGIAYWTARGEATAFADGICDYCQTSYYPFKDARVYERDRAINGLRTDLAVARDRAPHSKIVWTMPAFAYPGGGFRVPTAEEMRDLASVVYSEQIAGAWWYPWQFSDLYTDFLRNHRELYPSVRAIFDDYVQRAKTARCAS